MPYRTSHAPFTPPGPPEVNDDGLILGVALTLSVIGLTSRIGATTPWGTEPTLALLIGIGSIVGLGRRAVRALRRRRVRFVRNKETSR